MPCLCICLAASFPLYAKADAPTHACSHAETPQSSLLVFLYGSEFPSFSLSFSFNPVQQQEAPVESRIVGLCLSRHREAVGNVQHLFLYRIPLPSCRHFIPHRHRWMTVPLCFPLAVQYKYLQGTDLIAFVVADEDNCTVHTLSLPAPLLSL